ncbi:MAG: hypothetical protein NBKEAIPA_00319 [Nitrospirae bacterium]|nr:MAG: hypothetical protein UZ03_NOB001003627 [Nitrospira sp. OLB3]MBV6468454.1 hypothetical protein [Nitrospirota bacterium]QOJ35648.1 MAG: hypothetical protein HRU82_12160 [Nitrospira sp.]
MSPLPSRRLSARPRLAFHMAMLGLLLSCWVIVPAVDRLHAAETESDVEPDLQIEITKIGLGKEVVITKGRREWFMRVEVTPENSVVVRQEKDGDRYLLDDSEVHDRSMSAAEVDAAITDFINSVKTTQKGK